MIRIARLPLCSALLPHATRSFSRSKTVLDRNARDIEKLNAMIKLKLAEIEQMEKKRLEDEAKPKLSDFTRPILMTLAIASTVYFSYHLVWWNLEYDEREKVLLAKLQEKEAEFQRVLDEHQPSGPATGTKRWYKFW